MQSSAVQMCKSEPKFGAFRETPENEPDTGQKKSVKNSLQSSAEKRKTLDVKKSLTADEVLEIMKKQMGDRTQSAYAGELGITPQYLCDIFQKRRDPGPKVLSRLGLVQTVKYERSA